MLKFFSSLSLLLVISALRADNLVKNSSFEDDMKYWGHGPYDAAKIVQSHASDGKKALLFEGEKIQKFISATQYIPNVQPGFYKAEVDLFIESHTAGNFCPIYFQIITDEGTKYAQRVISPERLSAGARHFELWLDLSKYKKITLAPFIMAGKGFTGKIYADNFKITPYRDEPSIVTVPKGGYAELNNFMDAISGKPAAESTSIKIRHDDKKLYFSAAMNAYALDPVYNQMDKFQARQHGRVSCHRMQSDDSIRICLQNPAGTAHFIGFNAASAISLERESSHGWDGQWAPEGINLRSWTEKGHWRAELEIPLDAIGMKPDEKWKINVVRFDRRLDKVYVYAPTKDRWKDFDQAPLLKLGQAAFTFALPEFTEQLIASRNFTINADNMNNWELINLSKGKPTRITSGNSRKISLGASGIGDSFKLTIKDSEGEIFWRTPVFPDAGNTMMGTVKITGKAQVVLNGQTVGTDGGFLLSPGINRLTASGQDFNAEVRVGELLIKDFKEQILLREVTTLLPLRPDGLWHLTHNGTYQLVWPNGAWANGVLPEQPLNDFSLTLEYPNTLELVGIGEYKPLKDSVTLKRDEIQYPEIEKLSGPEPNMNKIRVKMDKPVTLSLAPGSFRDEINRKYSGCWFLFKAVGESGATGEIKIHAEAEQGKMLEIPNRIAFKIFPELNAPKLKQLCLWGLHIRHPEFENRNLNDLLLKNYRDAGFAMLTTPPSEYGREIGLLQHKMFYPIELTSCFSKTYLAEHPDFAKELTNPAVYSRTPGIENALHVAMENWKKRNPLESAMMLDWEYSPFGKNWSCQSETGYKIFAAQYNIQEPITLELTRKKYFQEWVEFNSAEVGEMIILWSKAAKKAGLHFYVYSGFQSEYTRNHYGVDWSKFGSAVDLCAVGYGLNPLLVDATRKAIGGKHLILGLLQTGQATQTHSAATMLRYLTAGRGGLLIWYETYNDARMFIEVEKCVKTIAPYEDFIARGKRSNNLIEFSNEFRDSLAVFILGRKAVIFLFNENAGPEDIVYTFKGKEYINRLEAGGVRAIDLGILEL